MNRTPEEIHKQKEMLHTAYQRAFIAEKDARDVVNAAIRKLRAAEKGLKDAGQHIAEFEQGQLLLK
jgi:hypothetical protein